MPARTQEPLIAVIDELLRLNGRIRPLFRDVAAATGLTTMELTVLAAVAESRRPPTVSQLGRRLGHPRQVIQRAADALLGRGLLETQANPAHRRAPILVTSAAGREAKARADAQAAAVARDARVELSDKLCRSLAADLRTMRQALDRYLG